MRVERGARGERATAGGTVLQARFLAAGPGAPAGELVHAP